MRRSTTQMSRQTKSVNGETHPDPPPRLPLFHGCTGGKNNRSIRSCFVLFVLLVLFVLSETAAAAITTLGISMNDFVFVRRDTAGQQDANFNWETVRDISYRTRLRKSPNPEAILVGKSCFFCFCSEVPSLSRKEGHLKPITRYKVVLAPCKRPG